MELVPEGRIATTDVRMKPFEQIAQLASFFQAEAVAFLDCRSTDGIVTLLESVDVNAAVYGCRQCAFQ
ncbi:hypothetical protein CAZ18_21295 [Pseudomonas aeruginosa]|nr:hypothetical protein CAY89_22075 [Pseudomonas aeruginosa]OTI43402.1 hypothetical protein CAZ18_21295 [Pseudomonas aeruginosa]